MCAPLLSQLYHSEIEKSIILVLWCLLGASNQKDPADWGSSLFELARPQQECLRGFQLGLLQESPRLVLPWAGSCVAYQRA